MKSTIPLLLLLMCSYGLAQNQQPATDLDELMRRVVIGINKDTENHIKLIDEFGRRRDEQKILVRDAEEELARAKGVSETLRENINTNEIALSNLNQQFADRLGNFGELFGVTRQVAADTRAQVTESLISAQFPDRDKSLAEIAATKGLPSIEQLRQLWMILLQEQIEQGRIVRFEALINKHGANPVTQEVLRLGPFTAISEQEFVNFDSGSQQLALLGQQPPSLYQHSAKVLDQAKPGDVIKATLDPSSGAILDLFIQMPSNWDRFKQGKLPGYVVTFLACIGLLIGIQRLLVLTVVVKKVGRQVKSDNISIANPLGRILKVYEDNPTDDVETLELKLNDAILKESPRLESGLNTLKVLAAVAPLLGLLGTVIGMIETFQAITLWGTGDPKLMANGISQALVTTVQGLLAAIPLLLLHSLANGRAKLVQQVLEEQSAGLIARRAEAKQVTV